MFGKVLNIPLYYYLANIYLLKVNNRTTRKWREVSSKLTSKLTTKGPERRYWHISHLFLVFLLLTVHKEMLAGIDEPPAEAFNLSN